MGRMDALLGPRHKHKATRSTQIRTRSSRQLSLSVGENWQVTLSLSFSRALLIVDFWLHQFVSVYVVDLHDPECGFQILSSFSFNFIRRMEVLEGFPFAFSFWIYTTIPIHTPMLMQGEFPGSVPTCSWYFYLIAINIMIA